MNYKTAQILRGVETIKQMTTETPLPKHAMSNIYLGAGKVDTPRSCNSEAYLKNYERIFRKKRNKSFVPPKPLKSDKSIRPA